MSDGGAVLKAASAGAARRPVQTVVMFVVLAMATTAALVGLALASNQTSSFQAVSTRYRIADLAVTIDAAKVTNAQLARTRRLPGVTKAIGYPATTVNIVIPATPGYRGGIPVSGPLTLVGRASRSGPLDDITQKSGRWPTRPGEIDDNDLSGTRGSVGQLATITVTSLPSRPELAIVGWGSLPAQDDTQNAWAVPGEITALEQAGAPRQEQMLYTFSHAATAAQVSADLAELRAALPAGAIAGYATALGSASLNAMGGGIHASSAIPYAIMALLLAAVIIAVVAAAAVTAGYRRIGVLKSIGFTPAQIAATYLTQLGMPAPAGALAGTALGNLWVLPLIQQRSLFKVTVAVPVWVNIAVPAGMLALTGLAALIPAVRAGRLSAVQAITAGQAPRAGRGQAAQRLAGRLPLPRPVTAGLAAPFTRPSRSAATLATITIGLTAADNVLLAAQLAGTPRRRARARCAELLDQLGIGRYRDTYPGRLSGGERQRVAIAASLINDPAVLLADEPTGAVDTATGEEIGRLLLDLNAAGQTLVLVTHSPDLAACYAKRTVRLLDGRVG
jgi:putative ABC transport system permease protein